MRETDLERIEAFQRLADENLYASYRLANSILGDASESQDAVHDAVVIAWQRWASLRDPSKFQAWFDRIVVNVCRDRLRRSARRSTSDIASPTSDIASQTTMSTPDVVADVHRRIQVEQAFAELKPDDTIVLALRHFVDLEIEDVAWLLGVPTSTAKTRLRAARRRLRDLIERQAADGVSR